MPPAKRAKMPIPFSATKLVPSTRGSRLAFRQKLGITGPVRNRSEAKANRNLIAAKKKTAIPHRSAAGIQQRIRAREQRKMENK